MPRGSKIKGMLLAAIQRRGQVRSLLALTDELDIDYSHAWAITHEMIESGELSLIHAGGTSPLILKVRT